MDEITFVSVEDVKNIHQAAITKWGGSPEVRDGLLSSAVSMPESGFGGQYFHETVFDMAAAYMFHIIQNHPFVDGNKRTGSLTAIAFMKANGFECSADIEQVAIDVATGSKSKGQIAEWFKANSSIAT